jgi:hypothetical protein
MVLASAQSVGWSFLVVGALSFAGHVLVPDTAGTPELGAYGGWILDAMSLLLGAGALSCGSACQPGATHNRRGTGDWL